MSTPREDDQEPQHDQDAEPSLNAPDEGGPDGITAPRKDAADSD